MVSIGGKCTCGNVLAEREGFEPPIAFRLWLISSQLHSTGLCHLSVRFTRLTLFNVSSGIFSCQSSYCAAGAGLVAGLAGAGAGAAGAGVAGAAAAS